jgi:hypothetical protein
MELSRIMIPPSRLSDFLGECLSPAEALSRLRKEALLEAKFSDDEVLKLIQDGLKESADEIDAYGFTWASADTRIAHKLSCGYLSKKGMEWLKSTSSRTLDSLPPAKGWSKLWKGAGVVALIIGIALLVGLM